MASPWLSFVVLSLDIQLEGCGGVKGRGCFFALPFSLRELAVFLGQAHKVSMFLALLLTLFFFALQ